MGFSIIVIMNRFSLYAKLFLINFCLFVFSYILNFSDFASIINFVCFLLSLLYFAFSLEVEPRQATLKIPEVHNFYKSRQNSYGNLIGILFSILSFAFFILNFYFSLSLGITVVVLWALSIPLIYVTIALTEYRVRKEKSLDYLKLVFKSEDPLILKKMVNEFESSKSSELKDLQNFSDYPPLLLEKVSKVYYNYINNDVVLTSEEIEEINRLYK